MSRTNPQGQAREPGLPKKIQEFVMNSYPDIVHKGTINRKTILDWNAEAGNAERRCREMENDGTFRVVYDKKGQAQYQWHGRDFDENTRLAAIIKRIESQPNKLWESKEAIERINKAIQSKDKERVETSYN